MHYTDENLSNGACDGAASDLPPIRPWARLVYGCRVWWVRRSILSDLSALPDRFLIDAGMHRHTLHIVADKSARKSVRARYGDPLR